MSDSTNRSAAAATAIAPGEATMKVRVTRAKDGSVEEYEGTPVEVHLPADLVKEYRALMARAREIEAIFLQLMTQGE